MDLTPVCEMTIVTVTSEGHHHPRISLMVRVSCGRLVCTGPTALQKDLAKTAWSEHYSLPRQVSNLAGGQRCYASVSELLTGNLG